MNGDSFNKADILALGRLNKLMFHLFFSSNLATFYSVNIPNMEYEIVLPVSGLPLNSVDFFNIGDLKSIFNTPTTTTTTSLGKTEKTRKRKLSDENEENDFQSATTPSRN